MTTKEWNKKVCSFATYFTSVEFNCKCGKCTSDVYLNPKLVIYLDEMRRYFHKPIIITSGIRCKKYNDSLPGSSKSSGHMSGRAADVYIKGVNPKDIYVWWKKNVPYPYCYYGTPNMGNACHVEVI